VAQHRGKEIVEIVGHATRELGQRLGALELADPLLLRPALGDLRGHPHQAGELAGFAEAGDHAVLHPAVLPVGAAQPVFGDVPAPLGRGLAARVAGGGAVVGMHRLDPAPAGLLLGGAAGEVEPVDVAEIGLAIAAGGPDHERQGVVGSGAVGHRDNLAAVPFGR